MCNPLVPKQCRMLDCLLQHSAQAAPSELDDPLCATLMAVLCSVDADLNFLCTEAQKMARRNDERIRVNVEQVEQQLNALIQHGFIDAREQRYGELPWLLGVLLEQFQIYVQCGSYVLYRATKQGRHAYQVYYQHLPNIEKRKFAWKWE